MALRWTAVGMLEAERQFRRVIGYRDLAKLALAAERELHRHPIQEVAVTLALREKWFSVSCAFLTGTEAPGPG